MPRNPKDYSYDSGSEMLAEYFLGQPRKREDVQELAQHIQDAVEAWFVEQNGWYVPLSEEQQQAKAWELLNVADPA